MVETQKNSTTGLLMSVIEILAKPVNDDIKIVCTAGGMNNNTMSENATLRIQG